MGLLKIISKTDKHANYPSASMPGHICIVKRERETEKFMSTTTHFYLSEPDAFNKQNVFDQEVRRVEDMEEPPVPW